MIEPLQRQHFGGELLDERRVRAVAGEHLDCGSRLRIFVAAGAVHDPEGPSPISASRYQFPTRAPVMESMLAAITNRAA